MKITHLFAPHSVPVKAPTPPTDPAIEQIDEVLEADAKAFDNCQKLADERKRVSPLASVAVEQGPKPNGSSDEQPEPVSTEALIQIIGGQNQRISVLEAHVNKLHKLINELKAR